MIEEHSIENYTTIVEPNSPESAVPAVAGCRKIRRSSATTENNSNSLSPNQTAPDDEKLTAA